MYRKIIKILLVGFLIGFVMSFVFIGIQVLAGNQNLGNYNEILEQVGNYMLYSIVLTFINVSWFDYLNDKVKWKKYARYRLLIGALGAVVFTMLGILVIRMFLEMYVGGESWEEFVSEERIVHYYVALLITLVVTVFFHAVHFYKLSRDKQIKEQKIIAGTASARFDALKNQLDPHFLFNSLNVLTSLIEEDSAQAQKFTTSLSKVYRYVLEQKNKDLVTVNEELQFARTYVRLLKMRFEDSIVFDIPEEASNPEAKIVPLSLQLLLENAVKHNVVTGSKPLHIKVFEEDGYLVIHNNLQEKSVVKRSSGVGLRNIQQRYQILTDRQVVIDKSIDAFQVSIPMLTRQKSEVTRQEVYIEDKRYQKAKERVEAIKSFYGNLVAYCMVIPGLAYLNYVTTSWPWVVFPAVGWGFGLLIHGMEAFGYNPLWGKRWEEKKLRELMERDDF
ncbi:2TM domain-containing protein [Lentiprolixibacter aurantiacus]|uniref:Histidine kinase n=1 Tax=Lentiprolixibacter aurantiacus TaxID=2993939 RepID=A0AAE3MMS2_9FLAO|nr:2TM domain-containing protein [Lentiprolixibacter aurantiacus]MCX2720283.1 histidine kinase [Lentiprolixibacter aurantiacus]